MRFRQPVLDVADITPAPKGLIVLLRESKTDQERRGQEVPVFLSNDPSCCPVRSLDAWFAASGITRARIGSKRKRAASADRCRETSGEMPLGGQVDIEASHERAAHNVEGHRPAARVAGRQQTVVGGHEVLGDTCGRPHGVGAGANRCAAQSRSAAPRLGADGLPNCQIHAINVRHRVPDLRAWVKQADIDEGNGPEGALAERTSKPHFLA